MKYRNLLLNLQLCASLFFTLKMESVWNTFWSKNDGEKWSRKDIFEILPCGRVPKIPNSVKKIIFPHRGISK